MRTYTPTRMMIVIIRMKDSAAAVDFEPPVVDRPVPQRATAPEPAPLPDPAFTAHRIAGPIPAGFVSIRMSGRRARAWRVMERNESESD